MPRIIDTQDEYVTLGVTDKNLTPHTELRSVTFQDVFGTPHTIHYHKDGPFGDPEAAIEAWGDGVLHAFDSHDKAAAFERDRGNNTQADRLTELAGHGQQQQPQQQGGGY